MGTRVTLEAADGFRFGAYRADPAGPARGGVVVIQEIFGVNHSVRSVCDRLADAGYRAMAPQLFDRIEPNFDSGYSVPEVAAAREIAGKVDWAKMVVDTYAAIDALKHDGPVAIMGFCMGGSVAFLAATRFSGLAAAICYYGGQIVRYADRKPKCRLQMHFGEDDDHISTDDVETIRQKRPECEIYVYSGAGHAFANEDRSNYELRSEKIAWQRSLALLDRAFASAKSKQPAAAAVVREETPPPASNAAEIKHAKPAPKPEAIAASAKKEKSDDEKTAEKPAAKKRAPKKPQPKKPEVSAPRLEVKRSPVKIAAKTEVSAPKKTASKKAGAPAPKALAKTQPVKKRKRKPAAKKSVVRKAKPAPKQKAKARPAKAEAVKPKRKKAVRTKTKPRLVRRKRKAKSKPAPKRKIAAPPKRKVQPRRKAAKPKRRVQKPKRRPVQRRPKPKPRPKSEPKPKPRPAPKPEPKPRGLWGFGLFSSPYYRRGRF